MLGVGEVVDDHLVLEDVEAVRLQNHHATEVDGKEDENPVEKDEAVITVKERRILRKIWIFWTDPLYGDLVVTLWLATVFCVLLKFEVMAVLGLVKAEGSGTIGALGCVELFPLFLLVHLQFKTCNIYINNQSPPPGEKERRQGEKASTA